MIINEDFFKELELSDEDVHIDAFSEQNKYDNVSMLEKHILAKYKDCIIFSPELPTFPKLEYSDLLPYLFKNLKRLMDTFGIDYETFIVDLSQEGDVTEAHSFGKYKILSTIKDKQDMIKSLMSTKFIDDIVDGLYIVAYLNLPRFTYKTAYEFINILAKFSLEYPNWKFNENESIMGFSVQNAVPFSELCDINTKSLTIAWDNYDFKEDGYKSIDGIKFKVFFNDVMNYFFKTPKDKENIRKMSDMIENGINPFKAIKANE